MVNISRETYERNGVETIVDSDQILWLNEKHREKGLYHKTLHVTTVKYPSDNRKHRYKLVEESWKQPKRIFVHKDLAATVIMDCRIAAAHKFRTRLRLKQYGVILAK